MMNPSPAQEETTTIYLPRWMRRMLIVSCLLPCAPLYLLTPHIAQESLKMRAAVMVYNQLEGSERIGAIQVLGTIAQPNDYFLTLILATGLAAALGMGMVILLTEYTKPKK